MKLRRKITVGILTILIIISALLASNAFALTVSSTTVTNYFDRYYGGWDDQKTPNHTTSDGKVAYCLAESKDSPTGNTYTTTDMLSTYSYRIRNGLQIILENGYPLAPTPSGLSAAQARYATANAIRFWMSENGQSNFYNYEDFGGFSDSQLRSLAAAGEITSKMRAAATAYRPVLQYAIELLISARSQQQLDHSVTFSPANLSLSFDGSNFVGSATVINHNNKFGYTLDTSGLPAGAYVTGYTGINGDTLTVVIPANYNSSGVSISLGAAGIDDAVPVNIFAYKPSSSSYQPVIITQDGDSNASYRVQAGIGTLQVNTPAIPDLTVPTLYTDKSVYAAGETITVTAVVQNQGKGWIDWNYTQLMGIADAVNNAKNPWESQVITYQITAPINSYDTYQSLTVTADVYNYRTELSKSNNSSSVGYTVLAGKADLYISNFYTNKSVYNPNETIYFTAVETNRGLITAPEHWSRIDGTDCYVGALGPGASQVITAQQTAPVFAADTYMTKAATADVYSVVSESDEGNNTAWVGYTVKAGLPDLTVTTLTTNKTTYDANETVTVTAVVKNQGLMPAYNFIARLSSSPNATTQDRSISLVAGESTTLTYTFTAPVYDSLTNMTLTMTADATNVINETNEGNNAASRVITINAGLPDLIVTNLTTDKGAYESGDTVTVTATVKNQGYMTASNFVTRLSANPAITPQDKTSTLTAGSTTTLTYTFTAPTYLTATAMTLTATADATNIITELNESNNTKTANLNINALRPDLTVISANTTDWYAGMEVLVSAKVSNLSLQPVPSVVVRLTAGSVTVNETIPIPGNGSNLAVFRFRVPSPGTVNITIKVDPDNVIGEINESNNQLSTSQAVVAIPAATFVDPDEPALESYFQQHAKTVPALPATTAANSHSWQEIRLESGSYNLKTYWATLNTAFTTQPDPRIAQASKPGVVESGFGVTVTAKTTLSTNYDHPEKLIGPQMLWLFYPESAYGQAVQWPTLHEDMTVQSSTSGSTSTITWEYPANPVSVSGNRLHYTPLWFPDNAAYATLAQAFYGWSPLGQMIDYATSSVTIQGDMYDRITVVRAR